MKRLASLCLILIACGETEPENQSPTAVGTIPDVDITTMADTAFDVSEYFTDDDGDTLMYRAESTDRTVADAVVGGAVLRLTTYGKIGSTDIKVVATDPDSAEVSLTFKVTAVNQPPVVARSIADRDLTADTYVAIDLKPYFTDPENLPLAYGAESDAPATVDASVSGDTLTISAGSDPGSAQVEVTATDYEGASVSQAFQVEVLRPSSSEWRDNFDSAGALETWDIEDPDGSSVEVDEEAGALLLHLPTDDYNVVRAHAREVADIRGDWVASTYMGLKEGDIEQCSEFTVHTGDGTYPSWQFEIDHWDESFLIYVRYSADNRWHSIWEGYFEDYTDDIPGVGDYYDLALSVSSDTLTVMYNETVQIARFHPKDDGDGWPGNGDVPVAATGVALGGSNCFGEGTIWADFVEINEIGDPNR
ncbi:MAG: hypothetical protein OXK74_14850 [Gemmatimonadota bacterium]|nr:hypothetical protein [Gemmatimonadota bacterium]